MNLLVSDFDGTFFDNNYKNNIKFIKKTHNIDFVIATGRNFSSLKQDLKIKCKYYICNDGGYVLDSNYNLLYKNTINPKTIKIIYDRIKKLEYDEYFFDNIKCISKNILNNVNKVSIKIKGNIPNNDIKYLIDGLTDVYAYVSTNWININSIESKKSKAIDFILNLNKYDKIYVIGNDINDVDMIKKYNGYFIDKKENSKFNILNSFLELESKIKND